MKLHLKNILFPFYVIALYLGVSLTSCEAVTEEFPIIETKNKTVLIYMVANNNLSGNAISNLTSIKKGNIPEDDNLIVFMHTTTQTPILLHVHKNEYGEIVQDTTYHFPTRNSASASTLNSVIKVVQTMYPATNYGLVLWSHGTGWLPNGYYDQPNTGTSALQTGGLTQTTAQISPFQDYPNGIDPYAHLVKSFGYDDGVEMEITDLVKALPSKFEFVIFDACLMGGIETAYELKDSVDYVIASPTEILVEGFPYSNIIGHMFSSPVNAKEIVNEYYNYYSTNNTSGGCLAAIKTSELENVAVQASIIFDKYRNNIPSLDLTKIQRYFRGNKHWFYDLGDFMKNLAPAEYSDFKTALDKAIIHKATTKKFIDINIDPLKFSGLSVYIPLANPDVKLVEHYKKFKWNTDSRYFISE